MMIREDILAKLTAEQVTKIHGESRQGDISLKEQELAEKAVKITTTEDMVEKRKKFRFLIVVLGKHKYGTVIGNPAVTWATPEDPGGYEESIQAKESLFDKSKCKKKHARKVIEYKIILGIKESNQILIIQAIEKPYLEALTEDCIGYSRRMPYGMIVHLLVKISKVTNKDKVQLKKKVFIM